MSDFLTSLIILISIFIIMESILWVIASFKAFRNIAEIKKTLDFIYHQLDVLIKK